jgi:chromosome segregation protein
MRLRKLRLSGFKSFVDPTTLLVPANLFGIVGPNGCGKSNIIDAVMWVMGESSAKHLRGDSLTDVIFNGSSTRQPVGQAAVELVFDNSEGKVGGQYASYSELSVKRQISRDGISSYFLNGTRCRRKDIQSIFLGTGIGPRSYAIIEQGMISRLIEARPEELRSFIEEAAGISRYRERRRETENRMRHTRENLDRLNDIREELEKQLGHLQRQSRAAEKYQSLKQEERRLRAELLALSWRDFGNAAAERAAIERKQETRVEEAVAALRSVEAAIEHLRDEVVGANAAHSAAQSRFYEVGSEIAQLEQRIQHAEERVRSLEEDRSGSARQQSASEEQHRADEERLAALAAELHSLEPKLHGSRNDSTAAYDALTGAEQAIQAWQSEWDAFNETAAGFDRQIEVDTTRVELLEAALEETGERQANLRRELETLDSSQFERELEALQAQAAGSEKAVGAARSSLHAAQAALRAAREAWERRNAELSAHRGRRQDLSSEIASLEALQRGDASASRPEFRQWLQDAGLAEAPRLMDELSVDPEWMRALETVLSGRLGDLFSERLDSAIGSLGSLQSGHIGIVTATGGATRRDGQPSLLDKVSGRRGAGSLLAAVLVADTLDEALALRGKLAVGESVVTRDGLWLGKDWVRFNRPAAGDDGILQREQRLRDLVRSRNELEDGIRGLEQALNEQRSTIERTEEECSQLQASLDDLLRGQADLAARRAEARTRLEQAAGREQQLEEELQESGFQRESDQAELESLQQRLERTAADRDRLLAQRQDLASRRQQHRQSLDEARARWHSSHEQSHGIALRVESISSQRASLEQALQRTSLQIDHFRAKIDELDREIAAVRAPVPAWREALTRLLQDKVGTERDLAAARDRVQELDAQVRGKEQERAAHENRIEELRSGLESARLAAQEVRVRVQTVEEQLRESGETAAGLLAGIEDGADQPQWQERLDAVVRRIERLGPINLAAIDEHRQLSERKGYLDSQHADLVEALETLSGAIRKIDRESRTRFKETFDRLNDNLKEMFPILFGGGHAYLEMTGDDLLETGVTVMARPPGKRISTIHLLSGGEKALVAVALVFAIFRLNPAPFCILDEVDAPLDDSNVGRFCEMVRDMSREVQFIFVTHNKITMEIAQQLLGVTMHEPGVSRLVSVDMDQAVELAATA